MAFPENADGFQRYPAADRPAPGGPPAVAAAVAMPRLLAETVDAFGATDESVPWHAVLTDGDRARLIAVLYRRGAKAALDPPTAADLVEAVLPESLAAMAVGPASRRRLVERIAQSLLEDPQSARRLQSLLSALIVATEDSGPESSHSGVSLP